MMSWLSDDMFIPFFRKNKPGMQPGFALDDRDQEIARKIWMNAAEECMKASNALAALGVHKQWSNRLLEWFGYINVLVSSTQWSNFFALRQDIDQETSFPIAQDEIYELTQMMKDAMNGSVPDIVYDNEWHLPFVDKNNVRWNDQLSVETAVKCSVARCARVSYLTVDGKTPAVDEDLKLYDRLLGAAPIHASPAEHQARPDFCFSNSDMWSSPELHGNFHGWIQYRKTLPNESI
jgi:hypothetical protein